MNGNAINMEGFKSISVTLGGLILAGALGSTMSPAKADTASTAAIAAGAAAIVGALLYDGNNRPYHIRNNHRYCVTQSEEQFMARVTTVRFAEHKFRRANTRSRAIPITMLQTTRRTDGMHRFIICSSVLSRDTTRVVRQYR